MPTILLFGATGFTGRLVAHALARRDGDFAIAGRDRAKLERLAAETGGPETHVVQAGDVDALARALNGARVLVTCVGPFLELGDTAVEAALRARVNYVDSTGEGHFIARLFERDAEARAAGIAMAPAMAFDEIPADVAVTNADLVLTYAAPSQASRGTVRSAIGFIAASGPFIDDGSVVPVRLGDRERWTPMPPPLGPRRAVSAPLAELHLAPRHLELRNLGVYATVGTAQRALLKTVWPVARTALSIPALRKATSEVAGRAVPAPTEGSARQKPWTILAEARVHDRWRNVAVTGRDVYGLSGELLAAAAMAMAEDGYDRTGVLAPTQAVDVDRLHKELVDQGVTIDVYEPR
jgi:short subunit dehydrogenase-like uncharacterized protein